MSNLDCSVTTPIKLASGDHIAEMWRSVHSSNCDWQFPKADREADYKQLPLEDPKRPLEVVSLRSPRDGRRYGFFSRVLLFGAIAAVIHYHVFSRIISELMCRLFGISTISYFDDFGALLPASRSPKGLETFHQCIALPGIHLKQAKSEVGPHVTALGFLGASPPLRGECSYHPP